jgi:predicted nicotinamide N-methyase
LQTAYDGPVTISEFTFDGRALKLARPADPDRLLNDPGVLDLNRRDDYMPYWAYLWPGAYLLAEAVARESWPPGTEAIEIGCGLGLAGLAALVAGLDRVEFSDYDETPLQFVARSAAENGIDPARFTTRRLDWRDLPDERFPVILGADVLYERRLVPLVTNLVARLLAPGGIALVAGPYRVASEDELGPCLERDQLVADAVAMTARDEQGRPVRGTLHRIRRRDPARPAAGHITVK